MKIILINAECVDGSATTVDMLNVIGESNSNCTSDYLRYFLGK